MISKRLYKTAVRFCHSAATVPVTSARENFTCFRVNEQNPINHNYDHVGGFYTIPADNSNLFQHGGLPKPFATNCTTFNEMALMIRKSGLDVINLMKAADYSASPLKYVLYGKPGVGKSIVMGHVLHYAHLLNWIIVHVPWVGNWVRSPKEVTPSTKRPGFVDLPENAVKWLIHFKTQNIQIIQSLNLKIANDYEWSVRESSKVGDALLDVIDLGINRPKHASEVIVAVLSEVKHYSKQGKCKTLVSIDGFNAFFHPNTRVRNEDKSITPPEQITFIPAFLDITKSDWNNSAIIVTCDELSVPGHNASFTPLFQLGKKGFEHLDPFIPIFVPIMADMEILSLIAYYKERRWLQNTEGDNELLFLCGGNPYSLMNICAPL